MRVFHHSFGQSELSGSMITPFVIDNQRHTIADILNGLLAEYRDHSLDIATAYFNVGTAFVRHEDLKLMCFEYVWQ